MDNPLAWVLLGALVLFVVVINVGLLSALRRKPGETDDGWARGLKLVMRAPQASRAARAKQAADLNELHERVQNLRRDDE